MHKRELLATTLERTGIGAVLSSTVGRWYGLLVFNYHRIGGGSESCLDRGIFSATQDEFDRQVSFLKKQFDVVRISDLNELDRHRQRAVMITFDDGYRDNYEAALPVLQRHNVSATFFLTSGFLDEGRISWWDEIAWMVHTARQKWLFPTKLIPELLSLSHPVERENTINRLLMAYKTLPTEKTEEFLNDLAARTGAGRAPSEITKDLWMSWEMVREMDKAGMDIGGHTVTHPVLARCTYLQQQEEILASKTRIESMIGHPITAFSYPVGQPDSFTGKTCDLLREAGYQWAFSFSGGYSQLGKADPLNVPRVAVAPHISQELFQSTARLPWLFA